MIYVYGASGHGKVVLDTLYRAGISVDGFIDDDISKVEWEGLPVVRGVSCRPEDTLFWGIGNGQIRKKIVTEEGLSFSLHVDPSAVVSQSSRIKEGSVVLHGAIVQASTVVGAHCIINTSATVDHDCVVGDYTHISPGATICGDVVIGHNSWIGAGATIIQGIRIGNNVLVGAGATVCNDIPDGVTVVGTPAQIIKR